MHKTDEPGASIQTSKQYIRFKLYHASAVGPVEAPVPFDIANVHMPSSPYAPLEVSESSK